MQVIDIVKEWLIAHEYDGLGNEELECGCTLEDFMPCMGEGCENCEPGYVRKANEAEIASGLDVIITNEKEDSE